VLFDLHSQHTAKDKVGKTVRAEVQLLKQKSSAYKIKGEMAQNARL
jgi:hypothetical protein